MSHKRVRWLGIPTASSSQQRLHTSWRRFSSISCLKVVSSELVQILCRVLSPNRQTLPPRAGHGLTLFAGSNVKYVNGAKQILAGYWVILLLAILISLLKKDNTTGLFPLLSFYLSVNIKSDNFFDKVDIADNSDVSGCCANHILW